MFLVNFTGRYLIKCRVSLPIHKDVPLPHFKTSIKCIHSLRQPKPLNPIKRFPKNPSKQTKWPLKRNAEDPKVYMRTTVSNIYRILKYSTWDSAQDQLSKVGIRWDSYTVNQVLKTHPPMEKAWLFFNWVSRLKGFKHDHFTYTTMLDIFGEAGRIESMNYVFKQMEEKGIRIDAVTYTSVMNWISMSGDVYGAMKTWEEMKGRGCYPTLVSYTAYIKILFDNKKVKEAADVYKEMLEAGIAPNCHTYTVLMDHLVAEGKYQEALDIFNKMQEAGVQPDKAACNILVEKCCKAGETWAVTQILQYMEKNHLVLRYPVFQEALKTLNNAGESEALLRQVNPHIATESLNSAEAFDFKTPAADDPLDSGLVLILLRKQNLVAVDYLLAAMMDKNSLLPSWVVTTIIEGNCDHCRPNGAILAFEYGMKLGLDLERTAYLALIGILIRSNAFPKVVEIVKEMIKARHSLGIYLGTLLIYRLGCARRPTCAAKIFNMLPDDQKCTATYTAMISVYFSAGSAEKGLKIFKTMKKKGIHPSLGTYNILLAGLERTGGDFETDAYRKEKKSLLSDGCQSSIPVEKKICDLLFAVDMLS